METDAWCCAPVIYVEDCFIFLVYSNLKEINYISHSNIRASVETSSPKLPNLLQFSPPSILDILWTSPELRECLRYTYF